MVKGSWTVFNRSHGWVSSRGDYVENMVIKERRRSLCTWKGGREIGRRGGIEGKKEKNKRKERKEKVKKKKEKGKSKEKEKTKKESKD